MAGYSGTPLYKKLGISPGCRVLLRSAPTDFVIHPVPDGAQILTSARKPVSVIVAFFHRRRTLEKTFPRLLTLMNANSGLWIGWPKKSSDKKTDLSFDQVQGIGLAAGLVDNKICALDEIWSGLRLVVRKENRSSWPAV